MFVHRRVGVLCDESYAVVPEDQSRRFENGSLMSVVKEPGRAASLALLQPQARHATRPAVLACLARAWFPRALDFLEIWAVQAAGNPMTS